MAYCTDNTNENVDGKARTQMSFKHLFKTHA